MISNRPLRIASFATATWILTVTAVPPARAQNQKRSPTAGAAAASKTATMKYVCFSTDPQQPVVYLSGIFDLPDPGSQAENFIAYELARTEFQIYLVDTYKYSNADDLADCSYMSTATTANTAAAMAARKKNVAAEAVAAKKRVVETGWKYTNAPSASTAANNGSQEDGRHAAQQGAPSRAANNFGGPLFLWHLQEKTDALSDEVSTQPTSTKFIAGPSGQVQGYVTATAYCSSNGVSVFFLVGAGAKDPAPSFPWYDDTSRGDDEQITDVRLRVDDHPVHVAQGFPEVDGHQLYTNTLGLLFYEPHTAERAVRDQEKRVATGVPAIDGLLGGIVKQTAQNNAQTWQSNAAGPLSDLVNARSIRVELPVTTFDPKPLLDLNPQDPVLHRFVNGCNAKFTR